jgi:hypothetical protein
MKKVMKDAPCFASFHVLFAHLTWVTNETNYGPHTYVCVEDGSKEHEARLLDFIRFMFFVSKYGDDKYIQCMFSRN